MKIIYYLKGHPDKPYLHKGSLKAWKEKMKRLPMVSKWYVEK